MRCPKCHSDNGSRVIDSRDHPERELRRRRHSCGNCGERFTTYEIMAAEYDKIQAVEIDITKFDDVIAALRSIKVQFSENRNNGIAKN
jgi:transcriptional regulator NrdR family protein